MLILPRSIAIGDLIAYTNHKLTTKKGRQNRYTFAGSTYFERMKEEGLYTMNKEKIKERIEKLNLKDVFNQRLI